MSFSGVAYFFKTILRYIFVIFFCIISVDTRDEGALPASPGVYI